MFMLFFSQSSASSDYVAKYDSNGNLIWKKTIGYYNTKICTDGSGNLYCAYSDMVIIKLDQNGVVKWTNSNSYWDAANDMIYLNNYIIVAEHNMIMKFNTSDGNGGGSTLANPSNESISCYKLAAGKDGYFYGAMSNGDIVKFDISLNIIWTIHISSSSNFTICADNSNNLCAIVYYDKAYKFDSNGNQIWSKFIGYGSSAGQIKFIDKNNYWYVTGNYDASITQFTPDGEKTWMFNAETTNGYYNPIYVDNDLNIYYMVNSIYKMRPEYTIIS